MRRNGVAVAAACALVALTLPATARVHRATRAVPHAAAAPAARVEPAAYIVVDADTGTVLAEKDAHVRRPPASMAKMMTVLIAMEHVRDGSISMDDQIPVSAWASRIGGSQVYLAQGESFPLREMLKAVMIASANDAAVAVAERIAGSTTAFVDLMNQRAKALGLNDTTYQSVHGLPPASGQTDDLTSAHDLAQLGRELMRYPDVMQWAGTATAGFRNDTLQMSNTNHLIRTFPGATGLKTGYHVEAGFCVTASATRSDMSVIAVVLGLPTKQASFDAAGRLMNEAFASYRVIAPAHRGAPVGTIPVAGGALENVQGIAVDDLRVLVKRSEDRGVQVEARIPRLVQAPIHGQQPLGEIVVRRGEQELGRVGVVADREVAATGWLSWLWNRGLSGSMTR